MAFHEYMQTHNTDLHGLQSLFELLSLRSVSWMTQKFLLRESFIIIY